MLESLSRKPKTLGVCNEFMFLVHKHRRGKQVKHNMKSKKTNNKKTPFWGDMYMFIAHYHPKKNSTVEAMNPAKYFCDCLVVFFGFNRCQRCHSSLTTQSSRCFAATFTARGDDICSNTDGLMMTGELQGPSPPNDLQEIAGLIPTWMSRWKLGSMVRKRVITPIIIHHL